MKAALLPGMAFLLCLFSCMEDGNRQTMQFNYPETRKDDVVDTLHGEPVPDPYRWLEDDLSEETAAWVEAQNAVTFEYLKQIPFRDQRKKRLETLMDYERVSAPFKEGDFEYFYKN